MNIKNERSKMTKTEKLTLTSAKASLVRDALVGLYRDSSDVQVRTAIAGLLDNLSKLNLVSLCDDEIPF